MPSDTDQPDPPTLDDVLPDDYVWPKPLPLETDDATCHNCGEPWNGGEEWDERHLHGGPSAGETWLYTCPGCGEETFEVGT